MIGQADVFVFHLLKQFFEDVVAGNVSLSDYLGHVLTDAELSAVLNMLITTAPVRVTQGFPRAAGPWPQITVALSGETATVQPVGYLVAPEEGATDRETLGMLIRETIEIYVVAQNADYGRVLHLAARQALMASGQASQDAGFAGMEYLGARDLAPAQEYLPEDVWVRRQQWMFEHEAFAMPRLPAGYLQPPVFVGLKGESLGEGVDGKVTVE